MGGGASNLSLTELQSYQSAISEVMQDIQNETSNLTSQKVDISQEINLTVGTDPPPTNPCADRLDTINACISENCRDIPAIYQCQLKKGNVIGPTSESLCDKAFGYTYEQSLDKEGLCNGGPESTKVPLTELRSICSNKLLRQYCIPNDPGTYISWNNTECLSSADCPIGTTCDLRDFSERKGFCGVQTVSGSTESTCGGECGSKTIYQVEYIDNDGKRKFTFDKLTNEDLDNFGIQPCLFTMPEKNGDKCYRRYNLDEYYNCSQVNGTGVRESPNCGEKCNLLRCTPEESALFQPVQASVIVENGNICLNNKASATFVSTQVAEVNTNAKLENKITNQFQSDISKIISQTNKGINFGQENNSQERTSITQKVRNTVSQSISSSAQNQTIQGNETKQVINFNVPSGRVEIRNSCEGRGKDCVESKPDLPGSSCPGGGLILSNEAVSEMNSNQTASSIVDALLNSNILNDLVSKYSFTATQKNDNDILGALLALLGSYFIFIILFIAVTGWLAIKVGEKIVDLLKRTMKWILLATVILIIIWIIVAGIIYGTRNKDDPNYSFSDAMLFKASNYINQNPSGNPPGPKPSDPSKPQAGEFECTVPNVAGSKCSVFIASSSEEGQNEQRCRDIVNKLQTDQTATISEQCDTLINRNISWSNPSVAMSKEYCVNSSLANSSLRNYTDNSVRIWCVSSAEMSS